MTAITAALALAFAAPQEEPREVLCLFDSTERSESRITEIHNYCEVVLNYLGLVAVYRDVNAPLPGDAEMSRFRGVLTWFRDTHLAHGREYWKWLGRQGRAGRKLVILGQLGATSYVDAEFINEGIRPLGLTYHGKETPDRSVIQVLRKDASVVEFERTLDGEILSYVHIVADAGSEVFLRCRRKDMADNTDSDLVMTGPGGGFAWMTRHYDPGVDRDEWHLNPFAFFTKAFGLEKTPRMDLAVSMGRRILFASIDGDGMANRVQPGPKTGRLAGEVVRDDFIKAIDLPVSASAIAVDLDEHGALARSIFELPNVEVAAHGYFHPLIWRKKTLAYPGRFSLQKEIVESVKRVQEFSPKPVKIFLWTGDCDPPVEAIDMVDRLGIANMNGWDPGRFQNYGALTNFRPAYAMREGRIQFSSRSMSENHFTDLWTQNFFAYRHALLSYKRGTTPFLINPIHIYFHYYVVEQPAGEAALRELYDWALAQESFPMTASEYVAWVHGFLTSRVERREGRAWRISHYGACRTVRFDNTSEYVDLARSRNVLGFRRRNDGLYVHLAQAPEAIVVLTDRAPEGRYLQDANGDFREGKIVAQTAAEATVMTPEGPLRKKDKSHVMELNLR